MSYSETHFVKQYEPGSQARVELANARIVDVVNGRYYDTGTSIILQGGKRSRPCRALRARPESRSTLRLT